MKHEGQRVTSDTHRKAGRYRMAALESASGVGREAIRFYIREGLLPEPERPSRTTAWYSDEHIRLLRMIRRLREDEMLPLSAIRAVLHDVEMHPFSQRQRRMLRRMQQRVHRRDGLAAPAAQGRRTRQDVANAMGLDQAALREAAEAGLIREVASDISGDEEELLGLWSEMRDAGLKPERGIGPRDMAMVVDAVDQLFAAELAIFTGRLGNLSDTETDALLDVVVPNINRMFALLHSRRVRSFVESFGEGNERAGAD